MNKTSNSEKAKAYEGDALSFLRAFLKVPDLTVLAGADVCFDIAAGKFRMLVPQRRPDDALNNAVALVREMLGGVEPPIGNQTDFSNAVPFEKILPALLHATGTAGHILAPADELEPLANEVMLMLCEPEREVLDTKVAQLLNHSTTGNTALTTHNGVHVAFVTLVDDVDRHSFLQPVLQTGLAAGATLFDPYLENGTVLYFQSGIKPTRSAGDAFLTLSGRAPFDQALGGGTEFVFLADHSAKEEERPPDITVFRLNYLRGGAALSGTFDVEVVPVGADGFADPQRQRELHEAFDQHGYRVSLRSGFYHKPEYDEPEAMQLELDRLRDEILSLETRLDYLSTVGDPSPVLYRFTQAQLGQMIATLAELPIPDLVSNSVLYGFAATPSNPLGEHYIYFDPETAIGSRPATDLTWWLASGDQPAMFNHDPFWAHYARSGESQVFVPRGLAIFPQLHSWRKEDMDSYLEVVMQSQGNVIPERPIYIFERTQDYGQDVRATIMSLADFRPFPEMIGWFNQNLDIQDMIEGLRERIMEGSENFSEAEILDLLNGKPPLPARADHVLLNAFSIEQLQKEVQEKLQASVSATEEACVGLLQEMREVMQVTTREAGRLREESEDLLRTIGSQRLEIEVLAAASHTPSVKIASAETNAAAGENSITARVTEIEAHKARSQVAVAALEEEITGAVGELKQTLAGLEQILYGLPSLKWEDQADE